VFGRVVKVFKFGIKFRCGDGKNVRFWLDIWIGGYFFSCCIPEFVCYC